MTAPPTSSPDQTGQAKPREGHLMLAAAIAFGALGTIAVVISILALGRMTTFVFNHYGYLIHQDVAIIVTGAAVVGGFAFLIIFVRKVVRPQLERLKPNQGGK